MAPLAVVAVGCPDGGTRVPATISAIAAVRWAEEIMAEIDRHHPTKHVPQQASR